MEAYSILQIHILESHGHIPSGLEDQAGEESVISIQITSQEILAEMVVRPHSWATPCQVEKVVAQDIKHNPGKAKDLGEQGAQPILH